MKCINYTFIKGTFLCKKSSQTMYKILLKSIIKTLNIIFLFLYAQKLRFHTSFSIFDTIDNKFLYNFFFLKWIHSFQTLSICLAKHWSLVGFRHTRCRDMKPQNHLWFSITTTINKMKTKINKGTKSVTWFLLRFMMSNSSFFNTSLIRSTIFKLWTERWSMSLHMLQKSNGHFVLLIFHISN